MVNPKPSMALLVALYKSAEFVQAKAKNLLRQTILNKLDIIFINCQNLDNEESLYKEYIGHPSFRTIDISKYCTLYHAWNVGIASTDATYIMNTNADDMLRPDACEVLMEQLKQYDVAFSYYAISSKPNRWNWDGTSPKNLIQPTCWERLFLGPCTAARRDLYAKSCLYDPELYAIGDSDMWGRWRSAGARAKVIEEPLTLYYHNHASLERRCNKKGKSLTWLDAQARKAKGAALWKPGSTSPIYPTLEGFSKT